LLAAVAADAGRAIERRATSPVTPELAAHGLLPEDRRAALRNRTLRDVVAPCIASLLAATEHRRERTLLEHLD
jgi:hypothetical protein